MAILKVAQLGHPVLRVKANPVPLEMIDSPELQQLIDDMIETKEEYSGVGLAAPQVHESVQIVVVGMEANPRYSEPDEIPLSVMINPKLKDFSHTMEEEWEGCLSLANLWGRVSRSNAVTITGYSRDGEQVEIKAEGFLARVYQHEIDHLYGKVFVDRMSDLASLSFGKEHSRYGFMHEENGEEETG